MVNFDFCDIFNELESFCKINQEICEKITCTKKTYLKPLFPLTSMLISICDKFGIIQNFLKKFTDES